MNFIRKQVLALLFLLMLPALVQAQFLFTTNNGTITITKYTGPGGAVVIPGMTNGFPVSSIFDSAFNSRTNVSSVTIPNSVTYLGLVAFEKCSSMTNVTIGTNVANIRPGAFAYCISLTNIMLPKSLTNIENDAFVGCSSLKAINVATNSPAYSSVDGVLLNKSKTTLIEYPGGKAGNYTVSNNIVSIADNAFESCSSLTNITIGGGVTNIGKEAFLYCYSLRGIFFLANAPSTASSGLGIFYGESNANVYYLLGATGWSSTFAGLPAALWYAPVPCSYTTNNDTICIATYIGSGGSVVIPDKINGLHVTSIETNAFWYCTNVTSVTIGTNVTVIGEYAFSGCNGLTNFSMQEGVTSIGSNAFSFCRRLTAVTIPNSVTNIADYAFRDCTELTTVTIGVGITTIGAYGFLGCSALKGVYFSSNGPDTNSNAFQGVDVEAKVYYLPGTTNWGAKYGGIPTALWNPRALTSDPKFGIMTNRFGFIISGSSNLVIVVEACTNLINPAWSPVRTNTLTGGSSYFSDPQWTNSPSRYYRLRSP